MKTSNEVFIDERKALSTIKTCSLLTLSDRISLKRKRWNWMINLSHLTVRMGQRNLLKDVNLEIRRGRITLITGKSGSGKSTLLKYLSLNEVDSNEKYEIDGHQVDLTDLKSIKSIQQRYFSYVFQDASLFRGKTVLDHLKLALAMNGSQNVNDKSILDSVKLNGKEKQKVSKLSGGERQRLALAMALAKDTPYIFLDEPIANLDEYNAKMMIDILYQLKNQGKGIVVVSHQHEIIEADSIYEINDGKLISKENGLNSEENIEMQKGHPQLFGMWLWKNKKHFLLSGILLGLMMGYSAFVLTKGNALHDEHLASMQTKDGSCEMLVCNDLGLSSTDVYEDYLLAMTSKQIESLKNIEEINEMYPFEVFGMNTSMIYYQNQRVNFTSDIDPFIEVKYGNGENKKIDLSEQDFPIIMSWNEKNIENRVIDYQENVDKGIYISSEFASQFNLTDVSNVRLRIPMSIPIGETDNEVSSMNPENGEIEKTVATRMSIEVIEYIELPIKGIKVEDTFNTYIHQYALHFYMNEKDMQALKAETLKKYQLILKRPEFHEKNVNPEWDTSAYIVEAKDQDTLKQVYDKILIIDPNFKIVGKLPFLNPLYDIVKQEEKTSMMMGIFYSFIIATLISLIEVLHNRKLKQEYAYIQCNGFSIQKLSLVSLVLMLLIAFLISGMTLHVVIYILNKYIAKSFIFMYFGEQALLFFVISYLLIFIVSYILSSYLILKMQYFYADKERLER